MPGSSTLPRQLRSCCHSRRTDTDDRRCDVQPLPDPPRAPADGIAQRPVWAMDDNIAFHRDACEHRFTEGSWDEPGPVGVWFRLRVPGVPDEDPSGAQRAVAADFGNGVSSGLPFDRFHIHQPGPHRASAASPRRRVDGDADRLALWIARSVLGRGVRRVCAVRRRRSPRPQRPEPDRRRALTKHPCM